MNEKEIAELRRQLRPDHNNITKVYGCYVNQDRTVVSSFEQSMGLTTLEESEAYLGLLKKTLSGTLGKNLLDIEFSTQQVMGSPEHGLLMKLRDVGIEDEAVRQLFYEKVISCVSLDENYLILLAHNTYDVLYRAKDDVELEDSSEETFSYMICSICPVKKTKPGLGYDYHQQVFHTFAGDWLVGSPQLGFLFPAFDDRSANIYGALCYTKNPDASPESFINTVFCTDMPKPAAEQKESFDSVLAESLGEECSMEVVQAVHEQLSDMIEQHKENKIAEPLMVSRSAVEEVLEDCGISEQHLAAFCEQFDAEFGAEQTVSPKNIIDNKRFEVKTPDVTIRVKPEARNLVQTRTIDGIKYIMIRAEDSVEVNGIHIQY